MMNQIVAVSTKKEQLAQLTKFGPFVLNYAYVFEISLTNAEAQTQTPCRLMSDGPVKVNYEQFPLFLQFFRIFRLAVIQSLTCYKT